MKFSVFNLMFSFLRNAQTMHVL